jgi:thioesterase domain-containing protein
LFLIRILAQTTPSLPQALQNVQKAQLKAASDYVPYVYPGRVVLFRASQQPPGIYKDQLLGWGEIFTGGIEVHEIPGTHDSITNSPILAEKLKACIERCSSQ